MVQLTAKQAEVELQRQQIGDSSDRCSALEERIKGLEEQNQGVLDRREDS